MDMGRQSNVRVKEKQVHYDGSCEIEKAWDKHSLHRSILQANKNENIFVLIIDIRLRTVTDFVVIPKLNEKETLCRLFVYTNPAMQMQRVFKFRTAPIFDLYSTKEEVAEMEF